MRSDEKQCRPSDLKERLTSAWHSQSTNLTCGILVEEVMPRCVRWLVNRYQGLSYEDSEDCFHEAVEGLLKRASHKIDDPYNYVFTSAKNVALDLLRERKNIVHYDPEWEGSQDADNYGTGRAKGVDTRKHVGTLQVITEAVLDSEISVRDQQLRDVFDITLPKLAPARRRLLELLMDRGADITNAALAELMGITETALKSLKSRTFRDLRDLLPTVAESLGVNFDHLLSPPPEVLFRRPSVPSPDDDVEPTL